MARHKDHWDAIIVGAGLGGLSCATTLAKKGLKVLVLEKEGKVGGYATQFTRKAGKGIEYRMDLSYQTLGGMREGGKFREVLEELGVFGNLDIKHLDSICTVKLPDFEITLPPSISLFQERLIELVPEEKEGIEKLLHTMKLLNEETHALMENPPVGLSPTEFAEKYPVWSKYMTSSNDDFLADHVEDPRIATITNYFVHALCLPPRRMAAVAYMSAFYDIVSEGTEYIQGGGYTLSLALRDAIVEHGGEIHVGNEVERILVEDGKCEGVRTTEGNVFKAPFIVCNAPAPVAFERLIAPEVVDPDYLNQIRTGEISGSLIVGLFGVRGTPEEIGLTRNLYVVRSHDMNDEMDRLMEGDYETGAFYLTNNTVDNPEDTPEGRSFLQLLINADGRQWCGLPTEVYKKKKAGVTEILIDRVAEFVPDIRDRLEVVVVATPHTMERYTSNPYGAIFSYSMTTTGHTLFRPRPDTPVPGLFLASAWTFGGPGYIPGVIGGTATAQMLLDKAIPVIAE